MPGKVNVADGDDHVTIQVGHVGGNPRPERPSNVESGTAENVREGNATVGVQVDTTGPVTIVRRG